ncbi:YtxH domain-containing protein [Lacticaseibacillus saniviri]|uniref:YtxH domain-containing protein n=1 Tax=Lacticaseibacillus saniviri JCM 17471 = DSM 24301 TaxID=1293598 RepID=A0A0R2MYH3_9LACO|nr:YtxH domain-containing protein [Lacticaseibacillus saniviri]KRO17948.1 hypothetical protein IV56_GL001742 [Lacticaseibacillus saniviri JCM 17471 = DSM 24301]MCG4281731.1 YtxH domain-containing protein [Lacticaseibacillus saniviri]
MAKNGHFLLGFIVGGVSALAATYFLTPQTSEDLKAQAKKKLDKLSDRAADYYDFAMEATEDLRENASGVVGDLKTKVMPTVSDDGLSDFDEQTAQLRDELTATPEVAANDDFDDIVLDGQSAFVQAKNDDTPAAPESAAAEPEAAASQAPEAASETPDSAK